ATGAAAGQPACRDERAFGEERTVLRMMRDLQPLAHAQEVNAVLAGDGAAPQCMDPDLADRPLAGLAAPAVATHAVQLDVAAARDRSRERECGPAGRVHLSPVVGLDDFGVVCLGA